MKHANALQAASRLLGHEDWHHARGKPAGASKLRLIPLSESGDLLFGSWKELAPHLCEWCQLGLEESKSRIIRIRFETRSLTLNVFRKGGGEGSAKEMLLPLLVVRPVDDAHGWLNGALSALEHLRRSLEESHRAILDGVAVLQSCSRPIPAGSFLPEPVHPGDAGNSELILLRQDNELDEGYEIARGDELICWSQLELAEEHRDLRIRVDDEDGAWRIGGSRYVWEFSTLRPKEYVPGLIVSNLTVQESRKLLRRYKLALRIFSGRLTTGETSKGLEYLAVPDECYRVDLHRLLTLMKDAGVTWEAFCADIDITQRMEPKLPFGFMLALFERLNLPDPNVVWARPTQAETTPVDDDRLLRALMPRVHHVTYRLPRELDAGILSGVMEAIREFSTSMELQKRVAAGVISMKEPLPYLVYAGDGEELRLKLEEWGLRMRIGVIPHLFKIDGIIGKPDGMAPFAFGFSLYLDIHLC